jgi:hypothetical protein
MLTGPVRQELAEGTMEGRKDPVKFLSEVAVRWLVSMEWARELGRRFFLHPSHLWRRDAAAFSADSGQPWL